MPIHKIYEAKNGYDLQMARLASLKEIDDDLAHGYLELAKALKRHEQNNNDIETASSKQAEVLALADKLRKDSSS